MSLTTSYHEDEFDLVGRLHEDPATGLPRVHVRHQKVTGQIFVYRLIKRATPKHPEGLWHKVGFFASNGKFIQAPEPNGKALSGNRIDLTLLSMAENGYASS